jgi:predicted DNA-binding antitoxin AbrB/MazE fold protein
MPTVIDAMYEDGVLKPLANADLKDRQRYRVTLEAVAESDGESLAVRGIGEEEAAELRARLESFAEDWESEEMRIYDDYDAAKSRL